MSQLSQHLSKQLVRLVAVACMTIGTNVAFGQATSILVDPNLDRAVRLALNKPDGDLTGTDLLSLTNLSAPNCGILSLAGLENARHLQTLDLSDNSITDIAPLTNLTELIDLSLYFNPIADHGRLTTLTRLSKLDLTGNRLKEIRALSGLTSLTNLVLLYNHVSDFSPLLSLTNLVVLDLGYNIVTDFGQLRALGNLRELGLGNVRLSDAARLVEFTNLYHLDLSNNEVTNPGPLLNLSALRELNLTGNRLLEPGMLAQFTNLTSLAVGGAGMTDLLPLAGLGQLRSLGLWDNGLSDLSQLRNLTNLVFLDVSWNRVTNFNQLARMTKLEELWTDLNAVSNLDFVQDLPGLKILEASGNQLTELKPLTYLTNLTRFGGGMNLLTNLNGLENLPKLSFVVVTDNLLDLGTSSEALNMIQTLTNRGVTVYFEPQARVPKIFVHTNWFIAAGQRTSIPFMVDCNFSPVDGPVCAAHSSGPSLVPDTNLALNALPGFYWWNLSVTPLKDQAGLVTLTLSITNYAGLGTNVAIQVEVVAPHGFDGGELDSQGLVWTTAGKPAWSSQTTINHDGKGAAQSGGPNSLLQTRVTGPGLLTFWWLLSPATLVDYGQFVVTSCAGTNVASEYLYPMADWRQARFSLPAGEWILQWLPSYQDYWYYYGTSNSLWIDEVTFAPGETSCRLEPTVDSEGNHAADGSFWVDLEGAVDQTYDIEVSNDLRQWSKLTQVTCFGFRGQFSDWNSGAPARFYRAKPALVLPGHAQRREFDCVRSPAVAVGHGPARPRD